MQLLIALPITALLILRSLSTNSLTYTGILAASCTALLHAVYPSPTPFALLCAFFLAGTTATKIKHDVKSRITLSSTTGAGGGSGGGSARTHVQVLVNSGVASVLVLLHLWRASGGGLGGVGEAQQGEKEGRSRHHHDQYSSSYNNDCVPTTGSTSGLILAGIVANYAAVAADTLSSELGILASSEPRLITRPWVRVPRGTNGGVTIAGVLAGVLGAMLVGVVSAVMMPFCAAGAKASLGPVSRVLMEGERLGVYKGWNVIDRSIWVLAVTVWGALGSLLDSLLGALLQASVVDRRTGKIVEGAGGVKVLIAGIGAKTKDKEAARREPENTADQRTSTTSPPTTMASGQQKPEQKHTSTSRTLLTGKDWLDNNQINLLMATSMTFGGMLVAAWFWDMSMSSIVWRR